MEMSQSEQASTLMVKTLMVVVKTLIVLVITLMVEISTQNVISTS